MIVPDPVLEAKLKDPAKQAKRLEVTEMLIKMMQAQKCKCFTDDNTHDQADKPKPRLHLEKETRVLPAGWVTKCLVCDKVLRQQDCRDTQVSYMCSPRKNDPMLKVNVPGVQIERQDIVLEDDPDSDVNKVAESLDKLTLTALKESHTSCDDAHVIRTIKTYKVRFFDEIDSDQVAVGTPDESKHDSKTPEEPNHHDKDDKSKEATDPEVNETVPDLMNKDKI
ncbi:hypothetical protein M569_12636 [Genlisea aurea]|uniref:Uncharacterized protein n=1 Tax=Genlisea aurea TaxID=192259 RepID=S8DQT7_9LAMI|nr:hypothetical protein M569_12636 [Genlisea aurea]